MKFRHPIDTKAFVIGVVASIAGVILWDIYKYARLTKEERRVFDYKEKEI